MAFECVEQFPSKAAVVGNPARPTSLLTDYNRLGGTWKKILRYLTYYGMTVTQSTFCEMHGALVHSAELPDGVTLLDPPQPPESQPTASLEQLLLRLDPQFKAYWLHPQCSAESLQGEPHTGSVSVSGPCLIWDHRGTVSPL